MAAAVVQDAAAVQDGTWREHLQRFIDLGVNHSPGLRRRVLQLTTAGASTRAFALPPLPSRACLVMGDKSTPLPEALPVAPAGAGEEERFETVWSHIDQAIAEYDVVDYVIGTAGEVWPAAAALCRWLADHEQQVRGTRVLELGAGMGAPGLYAAGLGASRVLLTDLAYETESYRSKCEANITANKHLFADGARVELSPLAWGTETASMANTDALGAFDWVLVSDCTFGSYALACLCQTLSSLLRSAGSRGVRVVLAHEHRYRGPAGEGLLGLPWLRERLERWDDGDEHLEAFRACALREGLRLSLLSSERPQSSQHGDFRWWSADLSIVAVELASPCQ